MTPKLFIVSTPIGNFDDISLRAITTLKEVDFIICEEFKEARRLLAHLKIEKELVSLNEHNEEEASREIFTRINEGSSSALISDCGTPLFSDPGTILVQMCIEAKISVIPIPGASSIMAALAGSGFNLDKFYYAGWLSPKSELRKRELSKLKKLRELIVLLETPYRLKALLNDVVKIFGTKTQVAIGFDLTLPTEKFFRDTASEVLKTIGEKNLKGEFVLIIHNR
jgi:16S rRNA (cytidine1402-2'-O)-methyltransferase